MNRETYAKMVDEDKAWLLKSTPHCCERDHILAILDASVTNYAHRERAAKIRSGEWVASIDD
jgi:hypothetical protein